jgi:hypothetical protein
MALHLVGNAFTEVYSDLCYMENWMNGLVQEFSGGRREYREDGRCAICPDLAVIKGRKS